MRNMLVKVCGLIDEQNLSDIAALSIDMIGLTFYKPSKQYLGENRLSFSEKIPDHIFKVGVFVNEELEKVKEIGTAYNLDYAQLHGNESIAYCTEIQKSMKVIKAFGIQEGVNIDLEVEGYEFCDYLLFDTKSPNHGGTGVKFKWETLNSYFGNTSFLLSGGLGPDDHKAILAIDHPALKGVDINSKFESAPGIKIVEKVSYFTKELQEQ